MITDHDQASLLGALMGAGVHLRAIGCVSGARPMQPPLSPGELPPRPGWPESGWIDPVPRPAGRVPRFGRMDRLAQLALTAACQAVAGPGEPPLPGERCGVAMGSMHGSHLSNELFWRGVRGSGGPSPSLFAYTLPSAAAAEISMHFGLRGPALTLAGGLDCGLLALAEAAACIGEAGSDWMLAGAADVLSPTLLLGHPPEEARELAEGACFMLLQRSSARSLARLSGVGLASGAGALDRARVAALQQASLDQTELRLELGPRPRPAARTYAARRGLSAAPLLASCGPLQSGELPLLVIGGDEASAAALCWTAPC